MMIGCKKNIPISARRSLGEGSAFRECLAACGHPVQGRDGFARSSGERAGKRDNAAAFFGGRGARACASVVLTASLAFGMVPATAWAEAGDAVAQVAAEMQAAAAVDTSWYDESQTEYSLKRIAQIAGLSQLVNSGVDFSGKTVRLSGDVFGRGATVAPIGTKEHPFNGIFDGGGFQIANFVVDASADSHTGLFGYAGKDSLIQNVTLSTVTLTRSVSAESGIYLSDIGLLVGCSEGSIRQCTVDAASSLSLSSAVVQKGKDEKFVISRVGGLAGICYGDVSDCVFKGSIDIEATSDPVSEYDCPKLVVHVGGVVGYQGDYSQNDKTSTKDSHGSIFRCVNEGSMKIETPSLAGVDRFGKQIVAQSALVGGIAGYARGSVAECTNYAYLRVPNAEVVGGIVGSLRSKESFSSDINGNYSNEDSDEGSADDPIECTNCLNIGIVYARASVGGIVGQAGTYTTIVGCMNGRSNAKRETMIIGTRWNKPFVAGIVGRTYGTVSYCGNLGIIASATWDNEDARTLKGASGYYSSGIAGGILYYIKKDTASGTQERVSELPTVFNTYHAGSIETKQGFRSRHIVGNNEGYVYDNVALDGCCPDNQMTYGESSKDDEAAGTASNNLIACDKVESGKTLQTGVDSIKGITSFHYKYRTEENGEEKWIEGDKDSVFEQLNTMARNNGWSYYWLASDGSTNNGYPVLNWQAASYDKIDLSSATLSLSQNAKYTGGEAVPTVSATLNGTTLLQNVDFRVIPQTGAVERSSGGAYEATIEGIGRYTGTSTASVTYDIDKGNMADCIATIDVVTFNWEAQLPSKIEVNGPEGGKLDDSEFEWSMADKDKEAIDAGMYDVSIRAKEGSNYEGELVATFLIKKAKFKSTFSIDGEAAISYLGKDYAWKSVKNSTADTDEKDIPVFAYTGYSIKPTVKNVKYLKHDLVEGKDYVVLYGEQGGDDSGEGDGRTVSKDNIGEEGKTCYGSVMIRYAAGSNFSNYENMLIKIADTGEKGALTDDCIVLPEGEIPYEGSPVRPVTVMYGGSALTEGVDYTIEYANNNAVGMASYKVVGMGRFEGTVEGTFEISNTSAFKYTWEIVESNGAKVAKITGFTYEGTGTGALNLVIPSTVEQDGVAYPVAIIGESAFGGVKASDYENDCKQRVESVIIPASVTSLEKYAFGSNSSRPLQLSKVTFEKGSQLAVIGDNAFSYCSNLCEIHIPAGVTSIGAKAFQSCSRLQTIFFETVSSTLPSSIAKDSFVVVGGLNTAVRVVGYDSADAVKKLAADNASRSTAGANGGKNFSFVAIAGNLDNASIAPIADQYQKRYSQDTVEPVVTVTLDGKTLTAGADYTVAYSNNTAPGTGEVTVTGIGSYVGSTSATFNILEKAAAQIERVAGNASADTAAAIAAASWGEDETSEWAILVRDDDFADAMSATGLAGALNAPIVLTDRYGLSDAAKQTIESLQVKNVYIIGGRGAMPGDFESELAAVGVTGTVERIFGNASWDTSAQCAERIAALGGTTYAVVAMSMNFQDALSMSSFAYKYKVPILLQDDGDYYTRALSAESQDLLVSGALSDSKVIVAGGPNAVPESSMGFLGREFDRIWGNSGYDTSEQIADYMVEHGLLSAETVTIASGAQDARGTDALAGAALAGRAGGVILLANAQSRMESEDYTTIDGFLAAQAKADATQTVYVLGGTYVLPEAFIERVGNLW